MAQLWSQSREDQLGQPGRRFSVRLGNFGDFGELWGTFWGFWGSGNFGELRGLGTFGVWGTWGTLGFRLTHSLALWGLGFRELDVFAVDAFSACTFWRL